jgi:D-sedoheptulose 7-phosphate isomerase
MNAIIHDSLFTARSLVAVLISDEFVAREIEKIARQIAKVYQSKGNLIIFGNGGSMCDAMHFAEELTGRFQKDRQALPAIAISDPGHLSCVGNDHGWDSVFSRAVEAYAVPGDMVIGISTSGNSANVIKAIETAQSRECFTCLLSGNNGGALKDKCDYQIIIPSNSTARIQEMHGIIIHILIELVEQELFLTDNAHLKDSTHSC